MNSNLIPLHRRSVLAYALGASLTAGAGAACSQPFYPQLTLPSVPVRTPTGVFMVAGAKAGSRLLAGGEHGVIIYSDDGGKGWHQAQVPVSVTITSIAFATPQVGWAAGGMGVVLGTKDGGASWAKQMDGLQEIALMNASTQAFIAAQAPGSDAAGHAGRRAQILSQEGPDKPFLCLLPVSANEVFAFGAYRMAVHSIDGGQSWTDWSFHIGDPLSHNIYGAANIGGAYYLVSEEGLIFRSTDGGKSFPQLAQPGQGTFFGICDTGAGGILAYGVAGQMFLSTDAGKSWNQTDFSGTANVNAVAVLAQGRLLAGDAGGGVWISLDGGRKFNLVMHNSLLSISALLQDNASHFLILSEIGVIPIDLSAMRG